MKINTNLEHVFPQPTLDETLLGMFYRREFLKRKVGIISKKVNKEDYVFNS